PLFSGLFMFFAHAATLRTQDLASLSVTILDPSGSAIGGAQVGLKNQQTGLVRLSVSTDSGTSVLPGLPAGGYQLEVEADRFDPYRSALVLSVGQLASLNIVLSLAGVQTQVEVKAAAQSVDADRSELSQVIDNHAIGD